jgi:lysophospholipase-2
MDPDLGGPKTCGYGSPTLPYTSENLDFGTGTPVRTESLDHLEEETDIEGLRSSAKTVYSIIEDEIRAGIPSNKIIIGGFSQGTSVLLITANPCPFQTGTGSGSTFMFT